MSTAETAEPTLPLPLRTVAGIDLPIAGRWEIDPGHSSVAFHTRHAMVTRLRGRFRTFSGEVLVGEEPTDTSINVTIDAASIDLANDAASDAIRGPEFLRVDEFPTLEFRSTGVRHRGDEHWQMDGDLTIRGVTKPVSLAATFGGAVVMPRGPARMGFYATGEIDRREYGLDLNVPMPGGGWLAGNSVRIEIDIEASLT
jgi:polyisoprenoid-binding protein YceI